MNEDDVVRAEVMRLHYLEQLSIRAIARRLHLARRTVRRHLGQLPEKPSKERAKRTSLLDPYETHLQQWLEQTPELKAPQVLERLRQLGYRGGISIVRDRIRTLRPRPYARAFLPLDFAPGEAMQVDWADFGFALPGIPRRVSAFVAVLAYSRHLYLEFALSQATGTFLRCMDRALAFYGGVTTADIFDNMKTVVLEHPRRAPVRLNSRFLSYANARGGFAVVACSPHHPQSKGRVERPIRFVRERFWPGRRFTSLADLNAQAMRWRDDFANRREHEQTGKIPELVFEHEEKPRLKPLPATPFDTDDFVTTSVTKMFRVPFDRNEYSVPWQLVSQDVLVRGNDDSVSVHLGPKCVAAHPRNWGIRETINDPRHREGLRNRNGGSSSMDPVAVAIERLGPVGKRYFALLTAGARSLRRESLRLTFLAELFGNRQTASAMDEVLTTGHVGVEYVEFVLRHKRKLSPTFTPLRLGNPALDGISLGEPDLSVYDAPVLTRDPGDIPEGGDS